MALLATALSQSAGSIYILKEQQTFSERGYSIASSMLLREDKVVSSPAGNKDNTYTYLVFIPPYYLNYCLAFFSAELFFILCYS